MILPPTTEQKRMALAYITTLCDLTETACTWQVFDDRPNKDWRKAAKMHGSLRHVGRWLVDRNLEGCGVFVTVAKTDLQGRKTANILRPRALFVDFDGTTPPFPHLTPSIVVQSANGQHWYWVCGNVANADFSAAQKRLALHYGSDPVVFDLPRVMRVPGFWHLKGEPYMVDLVHARSDVYTLAEVLDGLPLLPEPVRPPQRQFTPTVGGKRAKWREVDALQIFIDAGMYGRDMGGGKHAVHCPWGGQHTKIDLTGASGATVLWAPESSLKGAAVFRCAHSHCQNRYISHALAALGVI